MMSTEQEVWMRSWCAVARAESCKTSDVANRWANSCLDAFRTKFRPHAPSKGWLISNGGEGDERRFRTMEQGVPTWTDDPEKAIKFFRRDDAEMFAAEDDQAWKIIDAGEMA